MARLDTYDQHFLRSPRLVAELVGHTNIRKNDTVYDLGAGSGVITSVLAPRCKRVVAVENEPGALGNLRVNTQDFDNVQIVESSILDIILPSEPYKIFANIPFSLSSPVVQKFTEADNPPKAIYLIVQKQFARKIVPGNDHFTSMLAAQIGARYTARIRRPLSRTDFTPPPGVDTALLELRLRDEPLIPAQQAEGYRDFVAHCFARQKFFAGLPRAAAGIDPERRPSEVSLKEWVQLFHKTLKQT